MPETPIVIRKRSVDGAEVVEARGELDLTNIARLDEALDETSAATVVLDLCALTFVDSAGMRVIDLAHRRLARAGRTLLLVAPAGSRAAWTFRVAGFEPGVLAETVESALLQAAARADDPGS